LATTTTSLDINTSPNKTRNGNEASSAQLPPWVLKLRMPILLGAHVFTFGVAYLFAYALRFDFEIPVSYMRGLKIGLPVAVSIQIACFLAFRTLHGWWRYVTFRDLLDFVKPLGTAFVITWLVDLLLLERVIPRSVLIMHVIMSGILLTLLRSSWRLSQEVRWVVNRLNRRPRDTRVLMISNHHDTLVLANQINSQLNSSTEVVGVLSFEDYHRGSARAGIPIVGRPEQAPRLAGELHATEVWLVAGSIPGPQLAELKRIYDAAELKTQVIPAALDRNPAGNFIPIREIDIKDLLQREPIELDMQAIEAEISGRVILVTGAGGSIGSEICRQLLRFQPRQLVLVDHRENSVFLIQNELQAVTWSTTELIPAVGDILDYDRMQRLFQQYRPDFVYHAAAHKHVGLMELTPGEAVKNNVLGTKQMVDLADQFNVTKFVLISTDKAVNPTSVMGCTKQMAERYCLAVGEQSSTQFVAVRFGNVLGSNGSVVPIFKEQIARGGPITITDPQMTRYFMTIPEASQLVIQAGVMGEGGEIFVLDMGRPVKILDLAHKMIELAGLPLDAIEIKFTGARPGEKLFEELYFGEETMIGTRHQQVFAARHRKLVPDMVFQHVEQLRESLGDEPQIIRQTLKDFIPEYKWRPQEATP